MTIHCNEMKRIQSTLNPLVRLSPRRRLVGKFVKPVGRVFRHTWPTRFA
jgi:hypothetical protein